MYNYDKINNWSNTFFRTEATPLDASSRFMTYDEAKNYVDGKHDIPPVLGQIIVVTKDSDATKNTAYIITATGNGSTTQGTLAPLATESFTEGQIADLTNLFKWQKTITSLDDIELPKIGYAYAVGNVTTPITLPETESATGKKEILSKGDLIICTQEAQKTDGYKFLAINTNIEDSKLEGLARWMNLEVKYNLISDDDTTKLKEYYDQWGNGGTIMAHLKVWDGSPAKLFCYKDVTLGFRDKEDGNHVVEFSFMHNDTSANGYGYAQHFYELTYDIEFNIETQKNTPKYRVTHSYVKMS